MASTKTFLLFLILLLLPLFLEFSLLEALVINSTDGDISTVCIEMERKALLKFKGGVEDPSDRLSSWVGGDCCKWQGVDCNNRTGHVIKLDLRNPYQSNSTLDYEADKAAFHLSCLVGQISDSLLDLKYLNYLDLSSNDFQENPIPNFFGSFERLSYLNLSQAAFSGMIPPHLGNLSNLRQLDISASPFSGRSWVSNLNWLSGLSSLEYLNLGHVDLNKAQTNWLAVVNILPSLLELHLPDCELSNLPQSLSFVNFTSLLVLNLENNYFEASIPGWLFNASTLLELRLPYAEIKGPIPYDAWGNLCSLEVLDLSGNGITDAGIEFVDSLSTCSNSSLKELFLAQNQFSGHFPDSFGHLQNLRLIDASYNRLGGQIPNSFGNLKNLRSIDLSNNELSGQIPNSFGNLKNLRSIDLSNNELSGLIPDSIGNLDNLRSLDLSDNSISGSIPPSIGRLLFLEELDLSNNRMNGSIPESIGQLEELVTLRLDWNSWEGTVSEIHFRSLIKLEHFSSYVSPTNHSLVFNIRSDWIPPFSLKSIIIGTCPLSLTFPAWLGTQKELFHIILRNVGISDTIPEWLWKLSPQLGWLDLSRNRLRGKLPSPLSFSSSHGWSMADLSFNHLEGPLPLWYNLTYLLLGHNLFSGPIPSNIGEVSNLRVLAVSGNLLNGSIPSSLSKLTDSRIIDLSNNSLSGKIPKHWNDMEVLDIIDLSKNRLNGGIPSSICSVTAFYGLKLGDNNLSGELSPTLQNCTSLNFLDLGNNRFSGEIPKWIGVRMPLLKQLRLRGNMFSGNIPEQLCGLSDLRILDLALNNLSGPIPPCIGHLSALNSATLLDTSPREPYFDHYTEGMELVVKGQDMEFESILPIVKLIDLSSNNIWGEIPPGITILSTLGTLNLSRNQLTGKIPEDIGAMQGLETLDLSCNFLSGPIPPSMSSITSLNYLDLAHNLLSGPIPTANQFQTFNDPSMYEGNLGLCGLPLSTKCSTPKEDHKDEQDEKQDGEDDEDGWKMSWFFMSMGLGFPVGFWAVCGSLALKKYWRHAYFLFIDETKDTLYVFSAVNWARFKRKMGRNGGAHG